MVINMLFTLANLMCIVVLVEWVTQLITKKDYGFLCYLAVAISIYYMWAVIATGGIIR